MKTAIQLDFDGTITEEDISFLLLDTYADSRWREYLQEYIEGRITVGAFNKKVFDMVKADQQTMTDLVLHSEKLKIRPGFSELMAYCASKGIKVVITSNGLAFYINAILESLGIHGAEVHAAENEFSPAGMKVRYLGPDGKEIDIGFKEAYTESLKKMGYDVIYVGDGASDIYPCRRARYIFATATLLERCRQEKLKCMPFSDFYDVLNGLESIGKS
jgi:2-hydroxy-3-keto-5-methylthiopentenyl-1-phosphate phosphatase